VRIRVVTLLFLCSLIITISVAATEVDIGVGWRILNYASFSPFNVESDLRWVGGRACIGNTIAGIGFSVAANPLPFFESLIPAVRILESSNYIYVTTGATIIRGQSWDLWPLGDQLSMLPWIGVEAQILELRWLSITAKIETYLRRNSAPDTLGIGFIAYFYPFGFEY